jgi:hypothetical protein
VPIVYYHRVESVPADFGSWGSKRKRTFLAYDSLPTAFEAQLDWLQAHGYTTILPRDLAAHWDHGARLPRRPVILAFDEGRRPGCARCCRRSRLRDGRRFYLTLGDQARQPAWAQVRRLARRQRHRRPRRPPRPARRRPASQAGVGCSARSPARRAILEHVGIAGSMASGGFNRRLIAQVRRAGYDRPLRAAGSTRTRPAVRARRAVAAQDDVERPGRRGSGAAGVHAKVTRHDH